MYDSGFTTQIRKFHGHLISIRIRISEPNIRQHTTDGHTNGSDYSLVQIEVKTREVWFSPRVLVHKSRYKRTEIKLQPTNNS